MQDARTQPAACYWSPDTQPGPHRKAAAQLFGIFEDVRQEGSRPGQDDSREAFRAGQVGQGEQAEVAQLLVSGDEPREAPRGARDVQHVRHRVGRVRCRTESERGGNSGSFQVVATEYEPTGGHPARERSTACYRAQYERLGKNGQQRKMTTFRI